MPLLAVLVAVAVLCALPTAAKVYVVDDSVGLGRRFDGIGGLSGGGVSQGGAQWGSLNSGRRRIIVIVARYS